MNPQLLRVTNRIIERSRRLALLTSPDRTSETSTVHRSQLACGNWHTVSLPASQRQSLFESMLRNNIASITSYNDMLSAHQPYEHYPEIIRKALHEAKMRLVGLRAVFRRDNVDECHQGQDGMELSLLSRRVIAISAAVGLSHNMFDGALFLGCATRLSKVTTMAALSFGHLPAVFVPSGPMAN